jgi:hypothetical protein
MLPSLTSERAIVAGGHSTCTWPLICSFYTEWWEMSAACGGLRGREGGGLFCCGLEGWGALGEATVV